MPTEKIELFSLQINQLLIQSFISLQIIEIKSKKLHGNEAEKMI